jgi:two-component system, OmpR family, alkaline phosphatase synthesis response regulator PhoP
MLMKTNAKHIVVVEDEGDILDLLTYSLSREGYEVTGLVSGEQVFQSIFHKKPDLILMDLMMPGIGGLETCRLLKIKSETAGIPVIMVTARGEEADVIRGLEMGADDYITKPFGMKILLARINLALRRNDQKVDKTSEDTVIDLLQQVDDGLISKIRAVR